MASVTFGSGALSEVGARVKALGSSRVALMTDRRVSRLAPAESVRASLVAKGVDVVVYDEVAVEPDDGSFLAAARFASEGRLDGYVSVGGGSVIDTCKAAIILATYPADLLIVAAPAR